MTAHTRAGSGRRRIEPATLQEIRAVERGRVHVDDDLVRASRPAALERLCEDIAGLLFHGETTRTIAVEGPEIDVPTQFATPLGFIVNELVVKDRGRNFLYEIPKVRLVPLP